MPGCIEFLHPFLDRFWDFVSSMDQTKIPNQCFLNRFVDAGFGCHRKHFACLCFDVGLANIVIHSFRLKHSYAIASTSQFQLRSHGVQAATEHLAGVDLFKQKD